MMRWQNRLRELYSMLNEFRYCIGSVLTSHQGQPGKFNAKRGSTGLKLNPQTSVNTRRYHRQQFHRWESEAPQWWAEWDGCLCDQIFSPYAQNTFNDNGFLYADENLAENTRKVVRITFRCSVDSGESSLRVGKAPQRWICALYFLFYPL